MIINNYPDGFSGDFDVMEPVGKDYKGEPLYPEDKVIDALGTIIKWDDREDVFGEISDEKDDMIVKDYHVYYL